MLRIYTNVEKRDMLKRSLDNLSTLATTEAYAIRDSLLEIWSKGPGIDWTNDPVKIHADRMKCVPDDPEITWALQPFFSASNGARGGAYR